MKGALLAVSARNKTKTIIRANDFLCGGEKIMNCNNGN